MSLPPSPTRGSRPYRRSAVTARRHHVPPDDPDESGPRRAGRLSRLSNQQIALIGIAVTAVGILVSAAISILGPPGTPEVRGESGPVVDVDPLDALEPFVSLTHLSALVTLVDPDELGSRTTRDWVVDTAVSSPSGMLAIQVPELWSALDDGALPDGLDGRMLIGWSQPNGYGFVDGGEPGLALATIDGDDPVAALDDFPSPSNTCPAASAPARSIELEPALGTGAVRVLHDCTEADDEKYVWFQLGLTLVPPGDDDPPRTEVLTMSLTSTQDLAALGQILASMQVSAPERGLGPSGSA